MKRESRRHANGASALLLALVLSAGMAVAGCSSTADAGSSSREAAQLTPYVRTRPDDARVPAVEPPLESHPGDRDHFYVDTDDYVVWATPSTHTEADWEYRVVCFDSGGMQTQAFLKYVFSDEAEAQEFAQTDELLIPLGNVVYYEGWFGAERPDKPGVLEIAEADGNEYYVSRP